MELLERESLLRAMSAHLAQALLGQGRLVLLCGEAGVGKTAVLDRFAGSAEPEAEVLVGWCDPLSTLRPLGPWQDIAPGLGAAVTAEFDRACRTPSGAVELLRPVLNALSTGAPKVVILEDLHWADEATLDLLRLVARRIGGRTALLVASYRDDEFGRNHPLRGVLGHLAGMPRVHRHLVEPLSIGAVAVLAADHRVNVAELYQVTGGNPFFVTEVLGVGGRGIPPTVADAVAGRLGRVSPTARRAAEALAVIGSPGRSELVGELVADAAAGIGELLGAGLLRDMDGGVGFRHELARMAVLDAIPAPERARLHSRVLDVLRGQAEWSEDSELLAHHAESAGDGAAVLAYAPTAASHAAALGAHREAAAQYRRALRFGASLPPDRRADLLEDLARANAVAGQLPDALSAIREAIDSRQQLGDRIREGDDLRWLSFLLWPLGQCRQAVEIGRRAAEVLEAFPPSRELTWAYLNMCTFCAFGHDGVAAAEAYARLAVSCGRMADHDGIAEQAQFYVGAVRFVCAESSRSEMDGWAEMEAARADTLEAGFAEPAAFKAMLMGLFASVHRDHERARYAFDLLEAQSLDRDISNYAASGEGHRTLSHLQQGAWDAAADLASSILDTPGPPPVARIMPLTVLGLIRARRGDPGAQGPLDEALGSFDLVGWTLLVRAARAEAAWLAGDHLRAGVEAQRGLDATGPHTDPWVTGELARWVVLAGGKRPKVRAAEPFALELSGDWRAAAAVWDELGCPYDAALARLAGDVPALVRALHAFEALGARPAAGIAKARLRQRGERVGIRGPRRSTCANPHGLTTREREILDHVRAGLTGPQIAVRLHLSPKTVNHHVSAALVKLGVHTRAEAVRKLAE